MTLLLDTNAYVEWKRGHRGVRNALEAARSVIVSPVVLGELIFGFRNGRRLAENLHELETFLADPGVSVRPIAASTADRYARIVLALRQAGRPIPTNDVWIAAQAMETGAELISFDQHFECVPGLVWRRPAAA